MSIDVTHLSVNIESLELTRIEEQDGLGRVVVAAQGAAIGSKIIREKPAVVWKTGNVLDFVEKYQLLHEDIQCGILDMYHPPLSSASMQALKDTSCRLVEENASVCIDAPLMHKLMAIIETNAHEYIGTRTALSEFASCQNDDDQVISPGQKSALFLYASKVAHSCNPNTSYSSQTEDGCLEYIVIRNINEGDMVTISYLEKVWETPTHIRRQKLQASKSFFCRCERCMGPDYSRALRCCQCSDSIAIPTYDDANAENLTWNCTKCGPIADETWGATMLQAEVETEKRLNATAEMMQRDFTPHCPNLFKKEVVATVSRRFHPLHYLTLQAMGIYIQLCVSHAKQLELLPSGLSEEQLSPLYKQYGTPSGLRKNAAQMTLAIVLSCECIASQCDGRHCCHADIDTDNEPLHAPVFHGFESAFHACQDLMKCPMSMWPKHARHTIHRYIPFMRLQYGEMDADVAEIVEKIPPPSNEKSN